MEVLVPLFVVMCLLLLVLGASLYLAINYFRAAYKDHKVNKKRKNFKVIK